MKENEIIDGEYNPMEQKVKTWDEVLEELEENKEELYERKYVLLDKDNYYVDGSWGVSSSPQENGIEVKEFPSDSNEQYWSAYRYIDGEWIFDPNKASEISNRVELSIKKESLQKQMQVIKDELNELDVKTMKRFDEIISEEEYEPFKIRKIDLRRQYNELEKEVDELGGI